MSFAPTVAEPLRADAVADFSAEELGLRPGTTTFDEARSTLQARRLTGIVEDGYARDHGRAVQVLGADYQSRIHLFRGGVFERSLMLPTHGLPAYGLAVRLAKDGPADVLLVLVRDPLSRREEPPTLLSFRLEGDEIGLSARVSLATLVERHGGMTSPTLLGNDLADGVMLVARDRKGALWDKTYLLRPQSNGLTLRPQSIESALRCACVRAYVYDLPGPRSR